MSSTREFIRRGKNVIAAGAGALAAWCAYTTPTLAQDAAPPVNTITAAERAAGWRLLFDGATPQGWRGYKKPGFPEKGWTVEGGALTVQAGGGGGDLITTEEFGDFELSIEWRVTEKANSGIMLRVAEKHDATWQTGPEIQIFDDAGHGAKPTDMHSAGALYDLQAPPQNKTLRPVGEFNHSRILLREGILQHFLNGVKIIECRTDTPQWRERIAASKFKSYEGFGVLPRGHIALQDHGNTVSFRNIKVRDFAAPMPGQTALFNGRDLSGWKAVLPDGGKLEDVWSVRDGVIVCKGNPVGYIRTEKDYTNFVLKLEWRFSPVTKQAGNSGVLLRMQAPDKVWPKSVEAQLQSGNAGDFWNIDEFPMTTVAERLNGRNTKKTHFAEKPIGEWNEYEIIVDRGRVTLNVNGETLNEAWDVQEIPGKIGLQSEGAEIHFRNIRLAPID
ncbi:MAG: hypothetical protein FLDDKLPJ_02867 [Phycisphaerae bacterium]|nr:hypothetical protein [Phycisphaerae bacterium]